MIKIKFWEVKNISEGEKELILYGDIVDSVPWWSSENDLYITPNSLLDEMEKLKNASNITIRLNSGGGSVFVALAIYNQLKSLKAKKTVVIDGLCASAGTIIAMAGDVVKIPTNAFFMIHDPTIFAYDNMSADDLDKVKNLLVKCKESIIEVYKSKVTLTDEELSKMMSKETWMLGNETVEKGFADEVLNQDVNVQNNGKFLVVNNVSSSLNQYKNLPEGIKVSNVIDNPNVNITKNKQIIQNKGDEILNKEQLKEKYPDIYNQILNEGKTQGISEERSRLQEIEEISNRVDTNLLNKAKYEEPMDAKTLAFENIKLENTLSNKYVEDSKKDFEKSNINNIGVPDSDLTNNNSDVERNNRLNNLAEKMNKDNRRER